MTPSTFQTNIYTAFGQTTDDLVVEAVAGSGKSTTLEHGAAYLPAYDPTAMFAFNRDIVDALQRRMAAQPNKPVQLNIQTMNAFGWGICRKNQKGAILNPDKNNEILMSAFNMDDPKDKNKFYKFRYPINRIISLLKANLHFAPAISEPEIQEIADQYGIDLPDNRDFMGLCQMVWTSSSSQTAIMEFSDQIYQPLRMGWQVPKFKTALVDELQDLNPAQQQLMMDACDRFIGVGDRRQAIYAFAGADAKSLQNMIQRTGSKTLPLSVCYRCPKAVIRLAQKIVPEIQWCDWAPEGVVDTMKLEKFRQTSEPGNFVLCRVTADLVRECLAMIREGKTAMVKGKEIGNQIAALIDRTGVTNRDSTETLFTQLVKYQNEQIERLTRAHREQAIEDLTDRVETVKVLLEAEKDVAGVKSRINSIFSEKAYGVVFSTIHRAKGLESSRVFVLRPDLSPHPKAETPEAKEQEENLMYVRDTRVKFTPESGGELYFIPKN